ncbi:hypothetical protein, partial [Stutzerimonas stutzeri]|uniref:hypothetical protein n=1 Tax=Stutzerimonas stutzeri TaxID=316 RepID=UPI002553C818
PGALGYLMQRQLVAEIHPADFAHHFHTDHPVFSCSKIEQKQLNTWVSFQSAEQPLLGQFSVSGNTLPRLATLEAVAPVSWCRDKWHAFLPRAVVAPAAFLC